MTGKTIEIPKGSIECSGEILTDITPNRQRFRDQLFPDLPEGKWHIKAIGFATPIFEKEESLNG